MMDEIKKNEYAAAKMRTNVSNIIFDIIIYIVLAFVVISTVYPFWNTIAISLNDGLDSLKGGIKFFPRKFTWKNYQDLFQTPRIFQAGIISVTRTILQTILSVFCTSMLAYALSRKEFVIRKPLTTILVISMYVNAGLIPGYMLIKNLHLLGKYSVYIIPCLVDVFNFILVRTYIHGLPDSFVESARIDGANEFKIFMRIIFPLIVPSIAMVSLFTAVNAWNSWFDTYLYCSNKPKLHSLQYVLMSFLQQSQNQSSNAADANSMAISAGAGSTASKATPISIRSSITIVATLPILVVYPFVQKYFVVGMTIGGVKE
ncbi:putative aldouronate transport system permease protein [Treponema bryantii]|uniref:Putative aldouronate transport system permease protein n=1 Tax=Treponema bryantii TaxID=163 RepID=A0A1H9EKJ2_9SPIR|nr:carbohydrate ABC transporter permease [Treponema bryantii]BDC94146.1 sugar ABC transporter permease [Treponema bryantii]SEQ26201.1 putative aldouronate transport system permease protein [Treponema bryantii]